MAAYTLDGRAEARSGSASGDRAVALWLYAVAALVFLMVVVGGATRLTDSGLSITEWKPILGAIPPLDDAAADFEVGHHLEGVHDGGHAAAGALDELADFGDQGGEAGRLRFGRSRFPFWRRTVFSCGRLAEGLRLCFRGTPGTTLPGL